MSSGEPQIEIEDVDRTESFLRLLAEAERPLSAYVHSLVTRTPDAEDLLQECKIVMWKHFGSFEAGTNFLAWARKIALHQILNHRRSKERDRLSMADPEFIEAVAEELDRHSEEFERRSEVLRECLRKLPLAHRQMIVWRYFDECGIEEIAVKTGRSQGAVYRLLSRVRQALHDCVRRSQLPSPS